MQAFFGDPGQPDKPSAIPDHAEFIAWLQTRKEFASPDHGIHWYLTKTPDPDCQRAAQALIKAGEQITELERAYKRCDARACEASQQSVDLLARAEAAEAKVAELERKVYQPGVWRCAKCNFSLTTRYLNANTGTISAKEEPGEKCPNDGSPMWRVSYQEDNAKAWKWGEEQFEAKVIAEARVKALEESLTPSPSTKMAYQGMFYFDITHPDDRGAAFDEVEHRIVPWTVIKQIMAAILSRAALSQSAEA